MSFWFLILSFSISLTNNEHVFDDNFHPACRHVSFACWFRLRRVGLKQWRLGEFKISNSKHKTEAVNNEAANLNSRYERLQLLYQVGNVIHSTLEPQEALQLIVSEAVRLMSASSGSVVLINPSTGLLEIQASHNLPSASRRLKLRVGEGITGWVVRAGKPARVGDVARRTRAMSQRAVACIQNWRCRWK